MPALSQRRDDPGARQSQFVAGVADEHVARMQRTVAAERLPARVYRCGQRPQ